VFGLTRMSSAIIRLIPRLRGDGIPRAGLYPSLTVEGQWLPDHKTGRVFPCVTGSHSDGRRGSQGGILQAGSTPVSLKSCCLQGRASGYREGTQRVPEEACDNQVRDLW